MRYVALLRSINVGRHNRIAMASLKSALGNRGLPNLETYLQSGNVLFDWAPDRIHELESLFSDAFTELGLSSHAVVRSSKDMTDLIDSEPFADFDEADEHKFVTFLKSPLPDPLPKISKKGDIEIAFQSELHICFVSRPIDGVHRGLTTPAAIPATSRNWTVTRAIAGLLR